MNLLPYENVVYRTKLKSEEVVDRLDEITLPKEKLRFKITGENLKKRYVGEIIGSGFKIKKMIKYQNSFLPRISGVIVQNEHETMINVRIRVETYIMVFMFFCFGFLGIMCIATFEDTSIKNLMTLIPYIMIIFGYVFAMAAFNYESKKSKADLLKIFEGEIVYTTHI